MFRVIGKAVYTLSQIAGVKTTTTWNTTTRKLEKNIIWLFASLNFNFLHKKNYLS